MLAAQTNCSHAARCTFYVLSAREFASRSMCKNRLALITCRNLSLKKGRRIFLHHISSLLLALVLFSALTVNAKQEIKAETRADKKLSAQKIQEEQRSTREQQQELRDKLQGLKKELARTEADRSEAADALAQVERNISETNRKLRELGQQFSRVEREITALRTEEDQTRAHIRDQQNRLAGLLQRQYVNGSPDQLRLLFNGENPSQMQRELQYLSYVSKANAELIQDLRQDLARLTDLEKQAKDKQGELAELRQNQENEKRVLVSEQEKRKQLLASLSNKMANQRKEVGALQRDEQRLSRLVDNLAKLLAQQAAKEKAEQAERQEKARRAELAALESQRAEKERANRSKETGSNKPDKSTTSSASSKPLTERPDTVLTPSGRVDSVADSSSNVADFGALRGQLKLPVRGELLGRFGTPRNQIGMQGGTTWKGLFIRAANGAEVRAVAPGRVVFAEWLRGFGNLLIVDHGNQYLSIYGNNESLYKQLGERVKAGEALASVGNSGGNPETGLYFELRHQGQPFDPLKWTSGK